MPLLITEGLGEDGASDQLLVTQGLGGPPQSLFDFGVVQVRALTAVTVRVAFDRPPLLGDPSDPTDGLNPTLYSVAGPGGGRGSPDVVLPVPEDPNAVDLFYTLPIPPGAWTLTIVPTIRTVDARVLREPFSFPFTVLAPVPVTPLVGGAVTEPLYRRLLNPALRGPTWDHFIAAMDVDHTRLNDLSRAAYDQLFAASASGEYLERRLGELGVRRPRGVGLDDDAFRRLGLALANDRVTRRAVTDLLEAFYGEEGTRASVDTTVEPFILTDGDTVDFLLGELRPLSVTFRRENFAAIARASAAEVAAVIRAAAADAGVHVFVSAVPAPGTGRSAVRVYADARGAPSAIRVTGGRAQIALQFPAPLFPAAAAPFGTWSIAPSGLDRTRFTLPAPAAYDLAQVRIGDYVVVAGQEFPVTGSFPILDAVVPGLGADPWFEVAALGVTATVVQRAATSLALFRPALRTLHDRPRRALVGRRADGSVDLVLPVTTQVVKRGRGRAAYPPAATTVVITAFTRAPGGVVTATTASPHGLAPGRRVTVDGAVLGVTPPVPSPGAPGTSLSPAPQTVNGTTDANQITIASATPSFEGVHGAAARLGDGFWVFAGGKTDHGAPTQNPAITLARATTTATANGAVRRGYELRRPTLTTTHAEYCAAVALQDGRVLVTGGSNNLAAAQTTATTIGHQLVPAEVYTVAATAAMGVGRAMHGATTLADGRVLVAGGFTTYPTPLATAARWSPGPGTWAAAAAMPRARMDHGQILLANGKVLVAGGRVAAATPIAFCELYDPTGDTWMPTGNLTVARYGHALVTLPSGRVLAIGGRGYNPTNGSTDAPVAAAELYDPATGAWLPAGAATARERPAAVYHAASNCVYVVGGDATTIDVYDVAAGRWRVSLATLSAVRRGALLAPLDGSLLFAAGGESIASVTSELSHFIVPGAEAVGPGRAGGTVTVASAPNATTFTYRTAAPSVGTGGAASGVAWAAPAGHRGPYLLDPVGGVPVTAVGGTLAVALEAGRRYASLRLATDVVAAPATLFPDSPGWLFLRFGRAGAVGPVRYLGRLSATDLHLDASFEFPSTCAVGDTVILLAGRTTTPPADPGAAGVAFVTPSAAGRVAASALADEVVAGGIKLHRRILFPSDRGLGAAGAPTDGADRLSGIVNIYAGDDITSEVNTAREGT